MFSPSSKPKVAAIEWLAVARARTPSVPATTWAEATSQTLASTRISGAVCRSRRVRARAARSGIRPNLVRVSEIVRRLSGMVMDSIWSDHLGQANLYPSAQGPSSGMQPCPRSR